jgi:hypothetical protein
MGRPDRTATRLQSVGPAYQSPAATVSLQGSGGVGLMQVGADFSGRMSTAMLGGLVLGFVAFYIWTRGYQA